MPFTRSRDYWIEVPGGRFTVGLLPDEARRLAEEAARIARLDPPALSPNEWKNVRRWSEWEEMDCNVDWLTEYLLAHYPAHEVRFETFAIARRPITNSEYRGFIVETGELEPGSWSYPPDADPDEPAIGIDWTAAVTFASWAEARLPFVAEWERAVRGHARRLFPWGDTFDEGAKRETPDGIHVPVGNELCSDIWNEPVGLDRARWGERAPSTGYRSAKGGSIVRTRSSISSPIAIGPWSTATYGSDQGALRLVRTDGRMLPEITESLPRHDRADLEVRRFELKLVRPALEALRRSRLGTHHLIDVGSSNNIGWWLLKGDDPASNVKHEVAIAIKGAGLGPNRGGDVRAGFDPDAAKAAAHYNDGLYLVARSRETFRRVVREHGVFAWSIGYRLAEDGTVRARHVAACHMAFDKRIHTFSYQFRDGEIDTPISEITSDMITSGVLGAFDFYEAHADADRSPF